MHVCMYVRMYVCMYVCHADSSQRWAQMSEGMFSRVTAKMIAVAVILSLKELLNHNQCKAICKSVSWRCKYIEICNL